MKKIIGANKSPVLTKVSDIATRPLITVSEDATLSQVASLLMEKGIRRAVVVDAAGTPKGIVSDNALFRTVEEFGWDTHD